MRIGTVLFSALFAVLFWTVASSALAHDEPHHWDTVPEGQMGVGIMLRLKPKDAPDIGLTSAPVGRVEAKLHGAGEKPIEKIAHEEATFGEYGIDFAIPKDGKYPIEIDFITAREKVGAFSFPLQVEGMSDSQSPAARAAVWRVPPILGMAILAYVLASRGLTRNRGYQLAALTAALMIGLSVFDASGVKITMGEEGVKQFEEAVGQFDVTVSLLEPKIESSAWMGFLINLLYAVGGAIVVLLSYGMGAVAALKRDNG